MGFEFETWQIKAAKAEGGNARHRKVLEAEKEGWRINQDGTRYTHTK